MRFIVIKKTIAIVYSLQINIFFLFSLLLPFRMLLFFAFEVSYRQFNLKKELLIKSFFLNTQKNNKKNMSLFYAFSIYFVYCKNCKKINDNNEKDKLVYRLNIRSYKCNDLGWGADSIQPC